MQIRERMEGDGGVTGAETRTTGRNGIDGILHDSQTRHGLRTHHRVRHDVLGEVHDVLVVGGGEEHHLAALGEHLLDADRLVLRKSEKERSSYVKKPKDNDTEQTWCPCVAIMTSASSSTKTLIFLRSKKRNLRLQSRTWKKKRRAWAAYRRDVDSPVFRTPPPSRGRGGGDPSRAPKAQTKRGRRWTNEGGRAKGAKHIVTSAIHRIIISKGGIGRGFHKAQSEKQGFLNN